MVSRSIYARASPLIVRSVTGSFYEVRREQPGVYLRCLTLLVPREHKAEHSNAIKAMTDEQIERSIEVIEQILAEREAGANAKVSEGEAEVVPSLPAPDVVPDGPNKVMDAADTAVGARERKPRKRKVPSPASVIS